MRLRRIAYVVKVFPKLSETFVANEVIALRHRGLDVLVLSLLPPAEGPRHDFFAEAGLDRITSWDPAGFLPLLRKFQPQLLHAHFATEPTEAARALAKDVGCPFTFTAHGYDIRRKPPPDFHARAIAARAVITVSQANAGHITEHFRVPADRIHVIPCGVDCELFCPPAPGQEKNDPAEPPWLVCVARHVPVKNQARLLEMCALLRDRGVEFRCALVGDGPSHADLRALASKLGLGALIDFPGAATQPEVVKWWQRAAVALLTSDSEGMPVCLMEAGACGVPSVATAVGGVPELIEDGVTGLLAPAGDVSVLANAVQKLLENPTMAAQLGKAARQRMREHFALSIQVDRLLTLWTKLVGTEEARLGSAGHFVSSGSARPV